jgi:hypothetical protein
MIAVAKMHGFNPIDDNEADAIATLLVGLHSLKFQGISESSTADSSLKLETNNTLPS